LLIAEPPDFPRNLRVVEKGSRFIKLGWITSQDGNSPITQYIIEYKTEAGKRIKNSNVFPCAYLPHYYESNAIIAKN
jgi:hypothetical protein